MRDVMIGALALLMSGCAATYDPVQIGKDTYSSAGSWGWSSSSGIRNDLYKEASEFCARQGKVMDALQATGQDAQWDPGGKWAGAELTFMCLDRNDPQYARKQMQFQPNVRVQVTD